MLEVGTHPLVDTYNIYKAIYSHTIKKQYKIKLEATELLWFFDSFQPMNAQSHFYNFLKI